MPHLEHMAGRSSRGAPCFFVSGDRQARTAPVPPFFCRDPLQAAFPEDAGQAGQTGQAGQAAMTKY